MVPPTHAVTYEQQKALIFLVWLLATNRDVVDAVRSGNWHGAHHINRMITARLLGIDSDEERDIFAQITAHMQALPNSGTTPGGGRVVNRDHLEQELIAVRDGAAAGPVLQEIARALGAVHDYVDVMFWPIPPCPPDDDWGPALGAMLGRP